MPITPPKPRDYALVPGLGVGAVASLSNFLGLHLLLPPVYLTQRFHLVLMVTIFLGTAAAVYCWRVRRRAADPAAYSVRGSSGWTLVDDWRHQVGLWVLGLIIGGACQLLVRLAYRAGWLASFWPG